MNSQLSTLSSQLRFQVTLPPGATDRAQVQVRDLPNSNILEGKSPAPDRGRSPSAAATKLLQPLRARAKKDGKLYHPISRGSVTVRIYGIFATGPFTISWRECSGGRRNRTMRALIADAIAFAETKATALANHETARLRYSETEMAEYQLAKDAMLAAGIIEPLPLFVSRAAEAWKQLPAGVTWQNMSDFWKNTHPATNRNRSLQDILDSMLSARARDGSSRNTLDDWESRLPKFAAHFKDRPMVSITADEITAWLRALPVSRRTRNNYRGNICDFYRYGREAGDIPKNWNPLDEVPKVKNEAVRIEVFTPEETIKLFAARVAIEAGNRRAKNLIPFMAFSFFGGVRHEEMCAPGRPVLDWREIDLEKSEAHILPEVARKIGHDRILPLQPNLVAWIKPHAKPSGPICDIENVTNALLDTAARAGIKWKDNGGRKTFISSRLALTKNIGTVATEAGTSPDRIRHNYKKTLPDREAVKHFNIFPTNSEVLQVNFKFA